MLNQSPAGVDDEVDILLAKVNGEEPDEQTIDILEIYGGNMGVSKLAVCRQLRTGRCADIRCGTHLTQVANQRKLYQYVAERKPLFTIDYIHFHAGLAAVAYCTRPARSKTREHEKAKRRALRLRHFADRWGLFWETVHQVIMAAVERRRGLPEQPPPGAGRRGAQRGEKGRHP